MFLNCYVKKKMVDRWNKNILGTGNSITFQKDLLKFCGLMCTLSKNQGFTNISSFLLIIFDLRAMSHLIFNLTKQRERERDTETDRETERDWSLTHVNLIVL